MDDVQYMFSCVITHAYDSQDAKSFYLRLSVCLSVYPHDI